MSTLSRAISFALLFMYLNNGTCLTCIDCNMKCEGAPSTPCIPPGPDHQVACLTETFKSDGSEEILQQKKCVLFAKNTRYECIDYPGYESIKCETCTTDLCNQGLATRRSVIGRISKPKLNGTGDGNIEVINSL